MVLAKRIKGSKFTQDDLLEITYVGTEELNIILNTIEIVSGVEVTHGGGGLVGDYLHYKTDGGNYSSMEMLLSQTIKGESIIKVVSQITTQAAVDTIQPEFDAWSERRDIFTANDPNRAEYELWQERRVVATGLDEDFTEEPPVLLEFTEEPPTAEVTIHKTGEIILDWTDDTFV